MLRLFLPHNKVQFNLECQKDSAVHSDTTQLDMRRDDSKLRRLLRPREFLAEFLGRSDRGLGGLLIISNLRDLHHGLPCEELGHLPRQPDGEQGGGRGHADPGTVRRPRRHGRHPRDGGGQWSSHESRGLCRDGHLGQDPSHLPPRLRPRPDARLSLGRLPAPPELEVQHRQVRPRGHDQLPRPGTAGGRRRLTLLISPHNKLWNWN